MAACNCNATPVVSDCLFPRINILIRTHRPQYFMSKCAPSVVACGYESINLIVCKDFLDGSIILSTNDKGIYVSEVKNVCKSVPYHYNLYLNNLFELVEDGWLLVLDDDDKLISGSLSLVAPHLTDPDQPVICQMLREGKPKPGDLYMDKRIVSKGRIGMPCMIIHSKHKALHTFEATEEADYQWIKHVNETLNCKFVKIPVVDAGRRNHGR